MGRLGELGSERSTSRQITNILAPQNFQMSGPADFNVAVNGLNHQILRLAGSVKTKKGGTLKISKASTVIKPVFLHRGAVSNKDDAHHA